MPAWPRIGSLHQEVGERDELADGAAAAELAVLHGGDAGAVVAAVLEPLQRLEDERRHLVAAEDRDDAAHQALALPDFSARSRSMIRCAEAGLRRLAAAGDGEGAGGDVVGDDRARGDQRAGADG